MEGDNPRRSVKTTKTIFEIIETLDAKGSASISELSQDLDIVPSTIHKHLNTLESNGYLVKDGAEYRNSLKFLTIGMRTKRENEVMPIARSALYQIAEESGELAWFVLEEHGYAIYLEKAEGEYAVQPFTQIGEREYLHNVAAGKAILAYLPEDRVKKICDQRGLKKFTENTITDRESLLSELKDIRERGYAFNRGETMNNHRAIASPILYKQEVMASIVLSGPKKRMTGDRFEKELPELVMGTANAIELELKKQLG